MTQIEARSDVRLTAPTRDGNGWSRTWTRVMYGVLWSFTAVVMPITGELRYTVSRYTKEINDLPRFGCDWRREHSITVNAETHGALTFKRTRPGLYTGSAAGEARYDVIRDPHRGKDNQWCVRLHGSTDTLSAHRLLKSAQRAAARYYGKDNAGALIERLHRQADAVYGECTGARDEQTLGRPRAHAGTVGTYRFTSGAADARLCNAHGDAYGDLATRVDDAPAADEPAPAAGAAEPHAPIVAAVAAFYVAHLGWPSLSQIVQRGADLDAAYRAIDADAVEHREVGGVRVLMLPVPEPTRPVEVGDVVTVTPDRHGRQFDVIEVFEIDDMVRVHPRRMMTTDDGPRWLGRTYVQRVPAAIVLPGDADDDDQGDAGDGDPQPQPTGPAGGYGPIDAAAIRSHRIESLLDSGTPGPADGRPLDTSTPLAQSLVAADHAEALRCTEATAGTGATVHVVVDGSGLVRDGHDVDQCPAVDKLTREYTGRTYAEALADHAAALGRGDVARAAGIANALPLMRQNAGDLGNDVASIELHARAADRAGRAYAELLMSHAEATRTSNTERAAMLAESLPLIRQAAIEAGADVPAIEREHGPGPVEPTVRARCWHGSTVDMRPLGWWHRGPGTRCDDPGPLVDELYGRTEVVVDRPNGGTLTYYVGQRVTLTGSSGVFVIESFETRGGVTPAPYAVLVGDSVPAARAGAYVSYLLPAPAIEIVERPKLDAGELVAARCTAGDYQSSPMTEARARRAGDAHLLDVHGIGEPARTVADMLMPAMPAEYRRVLTHLLTPFGFAAPEGIDKLVPSDANPEAFLVHDPTGIAVGVHDRFVRLSYPAEHAGEGDGDVGEAFVDMAYGTSFETVADLAIGLTQRLMRSTHLDHMRGVADGLRAIADERRQVVNDDKTQIGLIVDRAELHALADQLAGVDTECRAAGYARRATAVLDGIMVKLVELCERGGHVDPELLRSLVLVAAEAMTAPPADVEQLVEHIKRGADAAIVADESMTPADVDALVDTLVGAGWQLAGEPEFVLGKRVRYLVPPTAVEAGVAEGGDLPVGALRHQAPEGVPFVMCKLHGADCRSAQNGRPCAGMPAADELIGRTVKLTGCERDGGQVVDVTDGGRSVHVDTGEGITVADRGSVTVVPDLLRFDDGMIGNPEGELVDVGGYLACGCHGSQREHSCDLYAEPRPADEE
jgi:hypothetical protein